MSSPCEGESKDQSAALLGLIPLAPLLTFSFRLSMNSTVLFFNNTDGNAFTNFSITLMGGVAAGGQVIFFGNKRVTGRCQPRKAHFIGLGGYL